MLNGQKCLLHDSSLVSRLTFQTLPIIIFCTFVLSLPVSLQLATCPMVSCKFKLILIPMHYCITKPCYSYVILWLRDNITLTLYLLACDVYRSSVSYKKFSRDMSIFHICQCPKSDTYCAGVEDVLSPRL